MTDTDHPHLSEHALVERFPPLLDDASGSILIEDLAIRRNFQASMELSSGPQHSAFARSRLGHVATQEQPFPDPTWPVVSRGQHQPLQDKHIGSFRRLRTGKWKGFFSKEEVEILEAEFQQNSKPCRRTKMALADTIRADFVRVNNWFQNRRAREKSMKNTRRRVATQRSERGRPDVWFASTVQYSPSASNAGSTTPRSSSCSCMDSTVSSSSHCQLSAPCDSTDQSRHSPVSEPRWSLHIDGFNESSKTTWESNNFTPCLTLPMDANEPCTMLDIGASVSMESVEDFLAFANAAWAGGWSATL